MIRLKLPQAKAFLVNGNQKLVMSNSFLGSTRTCRRYQKRRRSPLRHSRFACGLLPRGAFLECADLSALSSSRLVASFESGDESPHSKACGRGGDNRRAQNLLLARIRTKANLFATGGRRRHQLANRVEYDFELAIVFAFQLLQLARQFGI